VSKIALIVPTLKWDGWEECWNSLLRDNPEEIEPCLIDNTHVNLGVPHSLHAGLVSTKSPLLAYIHDDVIVREPWVERVLKAFEDNSVGVVGFGGALSHGAPNIYRVPYDFRQLGRSSYLSNVDDAEIHGSRFSGDRDIAVLDGFALIIRRRVLEEAGGWPLDTPVGYVGYDYWACCIAHEMGYKVRLVGVRCHHLGGRSSVKVEQQYRGDFDAAHRYIYDRFQSVLPWTCA